MIVYAKSSALPITVAITNYNGADVLPDTMAALHEVRDTCREVLVVDDGSDDGSPEWLAVHHDWVRVIRLGTNTGKLNLVRNRALEGASSRYVFLMDNDIVVPPGAIETLYRAISARPAVLCCTPRLVYRGDVEKLYHDGGGLHYLCLSRAGRRNQTALGRKPGPPRPTIGCGIMMIDRERALELGGFDEGYRRGWGDDGEFHLRGRLRGLHVLQVSQATCQHVARPHGRDRILGQLYNRYRMLATAYSARSLLLLALPLVAFELALTVGAFAGGFAGLRFAALGETVFNLPELARRRSEIQANRVLSDGAIFEGGPVSVPAPIEGKSATSRAVRLFTDLTDLYWRWVKRWL